LCLQFVPCVRVVTDSIVQCLVHYVPLIGHRCRALVKHLLDTVPRVIRGSSVGLGLGNQLVGVAYPRLGVRDSVAETATDRLLDEFSLVWPRETSADYCVSELYHTVRFDEFWQTSLVVGNQRWPDHTMTARYSYLRDLKCFFDFHSMHKQIVGILKYVLKYYYN